MARALSEVREWPGLGWYAAGVGVTGTAMVALMYFGAHEYHHVEPVCVPYEGCVGTRWQYFLPFFGALAAIGLGFLLAWLLRLVAVGLVLGAALFAAYRGWADAVAEGLTAPDAEALEVYRVLGGAVAVFTVLAIVYELWRLVSRSRVP